MTRAVKSVPGNRRTIDAVRFVETSAPDHADVQAGDLASD